MKVRKLSLKNISLPSDEYKVPVKNKHSYLIWAVLLLVILLAAGLRVYKLDSVPPSLSWDEAANGYNAWSIANFSKDEWGNTFPVYFKSFLDDKHPVHIYTTAIFIKFLGLSEFSTRLPAAIFGVGNVILLFLLGKTFFKSSLVGLLAAFILAVSPYNLQFSRFNHEFNFTLLFFLLGLWLFLQGLKRKNYLLPLSFFSFGLSLFSYHSAKVVVPPMILLLVGLYFKELIKSKRLFFYGLLAFLPFIVIVVFNPALLGLARANQSAISKDQIEKTANYQKTGNMLLGQAEVIWNNYRTHFTNNFLFVSGDSNARHSSQAVGTFYPLEGIFLGLGLLVLLWQRSKVTVIILTWALLAPLPASLVQGAPHAARAMLMTGSWHLIAALGLYSGIKLLKIKYLQAAVVLSVVIIYVFMMKNYLTYYYGEYASRYAIEWQYGMKQIVQYVATHEEYDRVFMTDVRSQPYIFFIYYLKVPPDKLHQTIVYNQAESKSHNLIYSFDRYQFGGWNEVESSPDKGLLYVVEESKYGGLRALNLFNTNKVVKFPGGGKAFYLVSAPF